jgi:hypothetical protein
VSGLSGMGGMSGVSGVSGGIIQYWGGAEFSGHFHVTLMLGPKFSCLSIRYMFSIGGQSQIFMLI